MEPKNFDNLNNALNLSDSQEIEVFTPRPTTEIVVPHDQHLDADYAQVRSNLKDIIKQGSEAIDGILLVASETQLPRAYEVVATLIKSVADANNNLLNMHKQVQEIKNQLPQKQTAGHITNNSIFVGSTSELQALIKGRIDPKITDE